MDPAVPTLRAVLWVALGGALGAVARYLTGVWVVKATGSGGWAATFVVNVVGCLLLGFLAGYWKDAPPFVGAFLLMVGFLGSFTTFSTFALDSLRLGGAGALANVAGQVILGVGAAAVGLWAGSSIHSG